MKLKKATIKRSIKDRLIIRAATTGIFFMLQAANVKPPKVSPGNMDIIKLPSEYLVKTPGCHMGYCIFKTKHTRYKITITAFSYFFNLN